MPNFDPALLAAWRKAFAPPERLGIADFASRYVSLPASYAVPGRFSPDRSRYMLKVFEALQNPRIRMVFVQASVQTGKSLIAELFLPWVIVNRPANILWLTSKEGLALKVAETRLNPILESTEPVKRLLPVQRYFRKKTSIQFPNNTSLIIDGATERNCQSLSCAVLVGDEAWEWKPGLLKQFIHRADAFPNNSKILIVSQGTDEEHDFSGLYNKGSKSVWGWTCPHCFKPQELAFNAQRQDGTWAGIKWDKNDVTKPDGKYNLVEVAKTARLECVHCAGIVSDTPSNRRMLNGTGDYIVTNPNHDPAIVSFNWNKLAYIDHSFGDVVKDYLEAKYQDEVIGNRTFLKDFTTKVLARQWSASSSAREIKAAMATYDPATSWPDEAHRFFCIDVQQDCFWAICRAWSKTGESRLIWAGKLDTIEDVRAKQQELKVQDQKTFIDCGFDSQRVYGYCVRFGHFGVIKGVKMWLCWKALRGKDTDDFRHADGKGGYRKEIYSTPYQGNPNAGIAKTGQTCNVYYFATNTANDILQRHFSGKGPKFLVPTDDPIYNAHMNAQYPKRDKTANGFTKRVWTRKGSQDDHLRAAENMGIVAAAMVNCLGGSTQPEPEVTEQPKESTDERTI